MSAFDTATGWIAAAAFGLALLASVMNRLRLSTGRRFSFAWFRAHNWLGAIAAVMGVGHCLSSVHRETLPVGEEIGIWAGAVATGLLVLTAFAGSSLSGAGRELSQADTAHARRHDVRGARRGHGAHRAQRPAGGELSDPRARSQPGILWQYGRLAPHRGAGLVEVFPDD